MTALHPENLIEEHADYLLSFAMSKVHDIDLAKDLVQDTFFSALKNVSQFENRSTLKTWLTSILNRKIIDHWRKAETRYNLNETELISDSGSTLASFIGNTSENAETELIRKENLQRLHDCIAKLPEKWRAVIVQKYLEEEESDQICKELDLTPSNLWVIIHRAKILLKSCLTSN
jgi:RNA polymerase sigma-70 factor (ECF subfamily)